MNCHLLQHAKIKKNKKKNPLFHIKQTKKKGKISLEELELKMNVPDY